MSAPAKLRIFALLPLLLLGCGASSRAPAVRAVPVTASVEEPALPSMSQLYVADGTCKSLLPVSTADASPESAIAAILRSPALASLPLADTRVQITESTALVDLRMSVGTSRSLRDLSTCERLALLGGIRLTLQGNPRWGIRRVVFTDRGNLFAI